MGLEYRVGAILQHLRGLIVIRVKTPGQAQIRGENKWQFTLFE
jgi:hypothetical protein